MGLIDGIFGSFVDRNFSVTDELFFEGISILAISSFVIWALAVYVYSSLALMTIGKKLGYKNYWIAWVPIVNISMVLQMGGFNWAWVFLILIPIFGWIALFVLVIMSFWKIYEKRKYPGWFSLTFVVPQVGWILTLIVLGFVAWGDRKTRLRV